jgi:Leucine-rich repeat (LRR) protein
MIFYPKYLGCGVPPMTRNLIVAMVMLATCNLGLVSAQTSKPIDDRPLADAIKDETGAICFVSSGRIISASITRGNKVGRTIERLSEIDSLQTLSLEDVQLDDRALARVEKLRTLTSLMLSSMHVDPKIIGVAGKLPNLQRLDLMQCECRDEDLAGLAKIRSLMSLDLSATKVKGAEFEYLQELALARLNLTGSTISDESLKAIGKIHTLRDLNLNRTDIGDAGLMHLKDLYLLYNLPVIDTKVTNSGQTKFMQAWHTARAEAEKKGLVPKDYPPLKILDSREFARLNPDPMPVEPAHKQLGDDSELAKTLSDQFSGIYALNNEGRINLISIEDTADIAKAVDRIVEIPTIETVRFQVEHVDGEVIKKLGRLPRLTEFDAPYCKIQDKDAAGFEELKKLKYLQLSGNPLTDSALEHLSSLKDLEMLHLDKTNIRGTGFKYLQSLPRLRNIYLEGTPITDDAMRELGKIQSLEALTLNGTEISDAGIMHLTGLYRLFSLGLSNTKTTEAGRNAFRESYIRSRDNAERNGLLSYGHPDLEIGH